MGHFRPGDELNLDEFVGPIYRETYKYNWEDKLLSLRGYLSGHVDHTMPSSRNRDYARESPGFSYREELRVPSNGTRLMTGMTSETIGCDGGSGENSQNRSHITSPDITSYSRSYFGLLKERRGAHFYPEFDVKDYRRRDTSRTDFMDPIDVIDESRTCINDVGLRNHNSSSRGQLPHNNSDTHGSSYARKQDVEVSGYGSTCLSYDRELYHNYGRIEPQVRHSNEMDGGTWTREEISDVLRLKEYDPFFDRIDDRPDEVGCKGLSSVEPSERKLKRKHFVGEILLEHGVGRKGVRKSYHLGYGGEDVDPVTIHKEVVGTTSTKASCYATYSKEIQTFIGEEVRTCSKENHARFPWQKKLSSKKFPSVQDNSDGSPDDVVSDHIADHVLLEKPEPPEKSDEFKQLKCLGCESNSDKFVGTESLATNAFTSTKVGFRSQHLGLRNALCLLMGWKSKWICESRVQALRYGVWEHE
ncbi:unnamed protein product [Fraxinus pennsylvanica]|uniref:Uncharacterized protein n=1 Tax=Fraxinus pennsylvanica TaxID=56036 RepID=A0AAD2AGT8_9LAMI|nr:unnamed protein product [Fraxinus pennsylvanica]